MGELPRYRCHLGCILPQDASDNLVDRSVICVFRTDGGDGQPCSGRIGVNCTEGGHRMAPYGVAVSDSADFSRWLPTRLLPNETQQAAIWGDHSTNVGCARPKIETMANGALLLAGGRPSGAKEDPMLWLNTAGDAELWQPYSVSCKTPCSALLVRLCCGSFVPADRSGGCGQTGTTRS